MPGLNKRTTLSAIIVAACAGLCQPAMAQKGDDFPEFSKVSEDYSKVVSTTDDRSMWTLWTRNKDGQMLAELPRNFESQNYFFAMTVSSGDRWAGLQGADMYVKWKRFDKRLALIQPNYEIRTSGDGSSRDSVKRTFTDRVILDIPIVTMGPNGGPVIDLDQLLLNEGTNFFGGQAAGLQTRLTAISKAKAFPENVEVSFEAPGRDGNLRTLSYSIRTIPENTGYKPREADNRVGYFTTNYTDLGAYNTDNKYKRYINRWHLEKADSSLKLSPPKEPIVFYVEHTVPVRYRRWIKEGTLYWNKAFEKVGIQDAVQVFFQDKATGAHMDKDPEDARYNFILWLSNDISTAIGPSRVHPLTGQILDADIVLTDGWLRVFKGQWEDIMSEVVMEGMAPETLAWLNENPEWDPRVRLAPPEQRPYIIAQRRAMGVLPMGGHPIANSDPTTFGDDEYDGLVGRLSQMNGFCMAASGKAYDMAMIRTMGEIVGFVEMARAEEGEGEGGKGEPEGDVLDGVPESFVGPLLADLVAHEVGHTLGLRHNFKASSVYTMDEINSDAMKGKTPWSGSVMDYHPLNVNLDKDGLQGDYAPIDIGPYDMWAIEYGYTFNDTKEVLKRVAEPELVYATDEDTGGSDPLARRYDLAKDPLEYAKDKMDLARFIRANLLDKYVKDGESYFQARQGYMLSLREQSGALSIMANWVGGAFVNRDQKGDPNARPPIQPVPAATQRAALEFCIDNAFADESYGMTPELLQYLTVDKWYDRGGSLEDAPWPVHDRVLAIQSSTLTMLMNPTTLSRVYDNEFRVPAGEDALTLPEVLFGVSDAVWSELDQRLEKRYTAREPMISSLRRNLQSEHLDRMIDLSMPDGMYGPAAKPVADLAALKLKELSGKIDALTKNGSADRIDPYTLAHLEDAKSRVQRTLEAQTIFNIKDAGGGMSLPFSFFGKEAQNLSNHMHSEDCDH